MIELIPEGKSIGWMQAPSQWIFSHTVRFVGVVRIVIQDGEGFILVRKGTPLFYYFKHGRIELHGRAALDYFNSHPVVEFNLCKYTAEEFAEALRICNIDREGSPLPNEPEPPVPVIPSAPRTPEPVPAPEYPPEPARKAVPKIGSEPVPAPEYPPEPARKAVPKIGSEPVPAPEYPPEPARKAVPKIGSEPVPAPEYPPEPARKAVPKIETEPVPAPASRDVPEIEPELSEEPLLEPESLWEEEQVPGPAPVQEERSWRVFPQAPAPKIRVSESPAPVISPQVILDETDLKIIGQIKKLNGIVAISVFNDDDNLILMGNVEIEPLLNIARSMLVTTGKIAPHVDWGSFVHMTLQVPEGNVIIAPYREYYLCLLTTRTINIGHIRRILRDLQQYTEEP
jgi:hypothetical protein